ncbi:MAG: UbiX family flavin prenyltransferase [Dehalococcoidia bacterium]|nr:UbiX family flavin prenyltransferase [Dehalococcoidia bacterium]
MTGQPKPIVVGVTGASGAVLARRCVEILIAIGECPIVVCTDAGAEVWKQEIGGAIDQWAASIGATVVDIRDVSASIASGTYETKGMIVVPCSMGTAAALAHGLSTNLLQRAADVTLKEGRPLVVVPRESPLSVIHLTNLLTLAKAGVRIVPPMLAFYNRPETVGDIVDFVASRALGALGIATGLGARYRYRGDSD